MFIAPLIICFYNLAKADILVSVSGMRVFLRQLQADRHHRAGMDAGHTADTAITIPDTLLSIQMKTFFGTDLCTDSTANAFLCNLIKIMTRAGAHLNNMSQKCPVHVPVILCNRGNINFLLSRLP